MNLALTNSWLPIIYLAVHSVFTAISGSGHRRRLLTVNLLICLFFLAQIGLTEHFRDGSVPGGRIILLWSPIVFFWWAYTWSRHTLTSIFGPGFSLDHQIIEVEERWFGQPSLRWARGGNRALTEILQFSYFSYFLYTFTLGFYLHYNQRFGEFQAMAFAVTFGYLVAYSCFPIFPTMGPRWGLIEAGLLEPGEQRQEGFFFARLTQGIMYNDIAHKGGAMPSAHTSTAVIFLIWCGRIWGWEGALAALILTGSMAIGAIYGRYHYVTDVLAGLALGLLGYMLGDLLHHPQGNRFW